MQRWLMHVDGSYGDWLENIRYRSASLRVKDNDKCSTVCPCLRSANRPSHETTLIILALPIHWPSACSLHCTAPFTHAQSLRTFLVPATFLSSFVPIRNPADMLTPKASRVVITANTIADLESVMVTRSEGKG